MRPDLMIGRFLPETHLIQPGASMAARFSFAQKKPPASGGIYAYMRLTSYSGLQAGAKHPSCFLADRHALGEQINRHIVADRICCIQGLFQCGGEHVMTFGQILDHRLCIGLGIVRLDGGILRHSL